MKLSIICSQQRLDELPGLRKILDDLYIESLAWFPISGEYTADTIDRLERCLDYSSYTLCLPVEQDFDATWFHYVLGHQLGRTDRLAILMKRQNRGALPAWISRFITIKGGDAALYDHYSIVQVSWQEDTRKKLAKRELEARGLEVTARSFIETVANGDRFLLGLFLDAGFSPSLKDPAGVPVLNHAIRLGHKTLVEPLLEAGADLNGEAGDRCTTPLMDSAAAGYADLTQHLIGLNADLEHQSRDGQTAVTLAVGNGRTESAVALIEAGADVDQEDMLGMSARKYAALYKLNTILELIETTV